MVLVLLVVFLGVFSFSQGQKINPKPIVGIVTQDNEWGWPNLGQTYIAASYFVESGGARAVPIFYSRDESYLESMFNSVNAVLFPGGGQTLNGSKLLRVAEFFQQRALKAAQQNDYFPVFGHCQGFEVLVMAITQLNQSQCMSRAPNMRAENISLPITFDPTNAPASRWFAPLLLSSGDVVQTLTSTPSTMNNHMWSLTPTLFQSLQQKTPLKAYNILSTSVTPEGQTFVSTFEANDYPLYAMQFHAEKPLFEWPNERINHNPDNIKAMSYFAQFLGREASKNFHSFPNAQAEKDALIYNYNATFSIGFSSFDQIYFFNEQ